MLVIYISQITNRIKYVFDYIFRDYLQIDIKLISIVNDLNRGDILISYGEVLTNAICFGAHDLLFESKIEKQEINCSNYNEHAVFFHVNGEASALPYDPFALVFYMLSRYEEYLPFLPDEHGRFPAKASLAYQNNFLEDPIVEYAIADIVGIIKEKHPDFECHKSNFEVELSYDVDAPFAYRGKGFFKNLGGSLQMIFKGKLLQGINRLGFVLVGGKDPFDQFYEILSLLDDYELQAIFFLLMEDKGEQNPSINHKHYAFDILAEKLARYHKMGIHPSYDCETASKLNEEKQRFRNLLDQEVVRSRQHFLKIKLPETYQLLESSGIKHDYSMAFPDYPGFRAGCSRAFPFYDLEKEEKMNLVVHPFCLMDATFEYYLKDLSDQEVIEKYRKMSKEIYLLNGTLHMLFHNDIYSGYETKRNWKTIKEEILWFLRKELINLST